MSSIKEKTDEAGIALKEMGKTELKLCFMPNPSRICIKETFSFKKEKKPIVIDGNLLVSF